MKELQKLDTTRKLYIIIIFVVLFLVGIVGGQMLFSNQGGSSTSQPTDNTGSTKSATTLSLSPASGELEVGEEKRISVMLSKGDIQAADVVLKIPESLEVSDIKPGIDFPILLNQQIEEGTLSVSVSLAPDNAKKSAQGELFSFTVKALAPTEEASIMFESKNTVAAKDGTNVLGTLTNATYMIK